MGIIAPAFVTINPSFIEPDIIMSQSQTSGAFQLLPNGQPRVKLGDGDLAVYIKRLDVRTKTASGQAAYNALPNVTPVFSYMSTPTYLTRVRAEYDHHDTATAGRWGVGIQNAYRLGMRQGHFNIMRTALLYGFNPASGEGLANAIGATSTNLPADGSGNTTISTYDNGQLGLYLLQLISSIKTRTNNLGVGRDFTILAPQRILAQMEYNVVQLTQYQRPGAGSTSTVGLVKGVADMNGDDVKWVADDTLIGKGAGGTDLIIISMPEIERIEAETEINTNEFAKLEPGMLECNAMYCDMMAPREITAPLPAGAVDVVSEHRISAGWAMRPEATTLLSAAF